MKGSERKATFVRDNFDILAWLLAGMVWLVTATGAQFGKPERTTATKGF